MPHRIALIHAVEAAMQPVEDAFRQLWPEAERANVLDDALMPDRARAGELTPALSERILKLAAYGRGLGATGVLFTCSAFGAAIEEAARRASWPVLKPNEAMFEEALEKGTDIGMVASFHASLPGMEAEFRELARARGSKATIRSLAVPEALAAYQRGDVATHNTLLAEGAARLGPCDAIMLAQFSTARAADALRARVACPVLTSPGAAVAKMRRLVGA